MSENPPFKNGVRIFLTTLYKNEIIHGKENMKGFFNDYLQNKAATLYLFKVQEECIFESENGTIQVSFSLINNSTELGAVYYVIKN